jgi:hypothetical protein
MKYIKIHLFLNSLVIKDKHGNIVDEDTAEDIKAIGEEVEENEELLAKEAYMLLFNNKPYMLVFRDEDEDAGIPITVIQGIEEQFMFNISETPEEFIEAILKANEEAFKKEIKQLEINFVKQ